MATSKQVDTALIVLFVSFPPDFQEGSLNRSFIGESGQFSCDITMSLIDSTLFLSINPERRKLL